MKKDDDYQAILDRIEEARNGEFLTDLDIKEYLMDKRTGIITDKQSQLADTLFSTYMTDYEKDVELELKEKKTIKVGNYDGVPKYYRTYMSWKKYPEQEQFLAERIKANKTTKQIIYEYNTHFMQSNQARTSSSIKTKIYRLK